ncbi:Glutathione-S-transferase theta, GST [Trichophyton interdigitale]|uniref:Glutathione-S-transferase theta, GST n=2 Tax=Trichophyton TaxID=5550 RepID=A0A9P4YIL0_9EURO|nr:Glutathione-S-transferase theta, GST [Trichophyton interdigitale]KAF3897672.1 Glutathione-S-transferase theta, GST [Trichophyton interdigitale]KAG8208093.1 Glutathione-S-transferase theta, GST [Trichophyton interdigitale]
MGLPPDADIHPTATGRAKELVDKHSKEQPLKLYSGWFCPGPNTLAIVQRVWIVLEEKRIPYQYIEVNPYKKPDSLLALNPRGLVPTLACPTIQPDGSTAVKPLYESTVINEFLEDAFPNPEQPLHPADPYQKARGRIWIDYVTSRITPSFYRFLQYQGEEEGLNKARREFLGHLKEFILAMDEIGPFFHGSNFMMPDIMLAPLAIRFWIIDQFKKGGLGIPAPGEGGDDEVVWNRWRMWLAVVETRESVASTMSDKEHSMPIYKRYADDVAQSELAKATRAGKGVP